MVREVSDKDFQNIVLKSDIPVLVDFWAPWCGPCQMVSPLIEKLSDRYADNIGFFKVNVDQAPETAQFYGITSIPTLMIFNKGWKVDQVIGAIPESAIESMINEVL
jgi:thioredoxin 1